VVFDAAGLGATGFDVGAEQRFEGFGFFRAGLGVQDDLTATIRCLFVRFDQNSFVVAVLISCEVHRYSAAIIFNLPLASAQRPRLGTDEAPDEKSPASQWRQTIRPFRRSL
jgi:hypothetical protein